MKKILIVNGSLNAGGAEKSCVSFLNTLPKDLYEVDLLLISRTGLFLTQVPDRVNIIDPPYPFSSLVHSVGDWRFYLRHSPFNWIKKIMRTWKAKRQHQIHIVQSVWEQWRHDIPCLNKKYDVAIGGQEGLPNYYVIDKVCADRKIVWIHNQYDKLGYNPQFDKYYFSRATIVATMSPLAQLNLQERFPEIAKNVWFIENITNGGLIKQMAKSPIPEKWVADFKGLKLLSIGRLAPQKAFQRAIEAADILKRKAISFQWCIIGEGSERELLQNLIVEKGLQNEFHLLGIRANPYPYISNADIIVVTSQFEGRSIAIDEAKILNRLVITTDYPTACDVIENGETGIICNMTPQSIADAILNLYKDKSMQEHIHNTLSIKKLDNTDEIDVYIKAIEGNK